MSLLKRLIQELRLCRGTAMVLGALALLGAGLDIVTPLVAQRIIDELVQALTAPSGKTLSILFGGGAIILITTVISRSFDTTYAYKLFKLTTTIEDKLRFKAYEKYLTLHTLYHRETNSGQIIGRIDRGCTGVYEIIYEIAGQFLVRPIVIMLAVGIVLFIKNPWIALTVLLPIPIYIIAITPLSKKIYALEEKAWDQFENVSKEEYDVAGNVHTVKSFAKEHLETQSQQIMQHEAREKQYRAEKYWKISEVIQTTISTTARVAVIGLGGYWVFQGQTTIGNFVLFLTLQGMAYEPLWRLSVLIAMVRRAFVRVRRLFTIIDEPIEIQDEKNAIELTPFQKEITLHEVSFGYREEQPAIRDVSVRIPVGSTTALVGRSGSGKTTFVNLLLRSFDPTKGCITIDGRDIRNVTQKSLRLQMAIVPQEIGLFSRSIRDNIAYGNRAATQQEIEEAAQKAHAHEFIKKLANGYNTMVGERGVKLSGGERQRVGIARALLANPRILILDEATSHLDTESERIVQKAMETLMKGRTTIVIAHRLSTVLHADQIIVFDKGRLVGCGKHQELVKMCEPYRRLYELQFRD